MQFAPFTTRSDQRAWGLLGYFCAVLVPAFSSDKRPEHGVLEGRCCAARHVSTRPAGAGVAGAEQRDKARQRVFGEKDKFRHR